LREKISNKETRKPGKEKRREIRKMEKREQEGLRARIRILLRLISSFL